MLSGSVSMMVGYMTSLKCHKPLLCLILFLFFCPTIVFSDVIGNGTVCELLGFNVTLSRDFTVDDFYCIGGEMVFYNRSMYHDNFSISVSSDLNSIVDIDLLGVDDSMWNVSFSADADGGVVSVFKLCCFAPNENVRVFVDGVENPIIGSVEADNDSYIDFGWVFHSPSSFEIIREGEVVYPSTGDGVGRLPRKLTVESPSPSPSPPIDYPSNGWNWMKIFLVFIGVVLLFYIISFFFKKRRRR